MTLRTAILLTLLGAACAASLSGCAETRPPLAETWGLSVRMAVENQKLDPTPGTDRAVTGLDGVYARNALETYRKSSEPDPQAKAKALETIIQVKEGK